MILVADASVLVAELLRERGRALVRRPDVQLVVAEEQWEETLHELARRLAVLEARGLITRARGEELRALVAALVAAGAIEVVSRDIYDNVRPKAVRRGDRSGAQGRFGAVGSAAPRFRSGSGSCRSSAEGRRLLDT